MSTSCYRAPMGTSVKWITVSAYVVLAGVAGLAFEMRRRFGAPAISLWITVGVTSVVGVTSLGARIRGYELTPTELVIRHGFGRRVVRLRDITSVGSGRGIFGQSIRLFASGGLWSFVGLFHHFDLGRFRAYVSDLTRMVMLVTVSGRLVISPDDPDRFVGELRALAPHLA